MMARTALFKPNADTKTLFDAGCAIAMGAIMIAAQGIFRAGARMSACAAKICAPGGQNYAAKPLRRPRDRRYNHVDNDWVV